MAKMAKQKQTDYSKGGHAISQTAIPLYQNALNRADDYLSDPTQYIDQYLNKYWSNNNANQSDFLRNYNRAMAGTTANNYAATQGGYSSAGKRAYLDQQYNQNDLASRLQTQGVNSAAQLAQNWYNSNLNAMPQYQNAYAQGKLYGDIDQYNNIAKQNNAFGNQALGVGGQLASSAGKVLSMIPTPITQGIGAGLQGLGAVASSQTIDPNSALAAAGLGGSSGGTTGEGTNQWSNMATSIGRGLTGTAAMGGDNWVTTLFGGNKDNTLSNNVGYSNAQPYTAQTMANNSGFGSKNYFSLR